MTAEVNRDILEQPAEIEKVTIRFISSLISAYKMLDQAKEIMETPIIERQPNIQTQEVTNG